VLSTLTLLLAFGGGLTPCDFTFDTWPGTFDVLDLSVCVASEPGDCLAAEAGDPQMGLVDEMATLNASGTTAPFDVTAIDYSWSQIAGPVDVTLSNATGVMATFTPSVAGVYEFKLDAAWYCRADSDTVMVEVTGEPVAPNELDAIELIGSGDLAGCRPVQLTNAGPGDDRLFIVCQTGTIRIVEGGVLQATPFLDISDRTSGGNEQGLLGLAFDPDYQTNGYVYINYTGRRLDNSGDSLDTRIASFRVDPLDPDRLDEDSGTILLEIDQPQSNHNGGQLLFGPDGYLYIGMGDGGGANDGPGHEMCGNGQAPNTLLGKILRIEVDGPDNPYTIPPDNPFVGDAGILDEIWAFGMRNPWRFSFDRMTGDLYIADVGQSAWEELDFQSHDSDGGENYGWPYKEGTEVNFAAPDNCGDPGGLTDPIHQISHGEGACSVIGGFVYRGSDIPGLKSFFLFSDFCSLGATDFRTLIRRGNGDWEVNGLEVIVDGSPLGSSVSGFGEDSLGEQYIVTLFDGIYKITGIRN